MFIKYTLRQELIIPADEYTSSTSKAIRNHIMAKYLFKVVTLNTGSGIVYVICVKVDSIEIVDNIILRKTGEMKVEVLLTITSLRLIDNQYYEGIVSGLSQAGIKVQFLNGLLEGTLNIETLHANTIYDQKQNQWILTTEGDGSQGYEWKMGSLVRFRINKTNFAEIENSGKEDFSEMI